MGGDDLGSDDEFLIPDIKVTRSEEDETSDDGSRKRKMSQENMDEPSKTKKKRKNDPDKLLFEAGIDLEEKSAEQQASFLSICLRHYSLISSNETGDRLHAKNFATSTKTNMLERLKDTISLSKMKKWKHPNSPCVIIVTVSARRAVTVLKELAPLKVRAAKLFPKNGDVNEQAKQLESSSFGIAVGTPHRLEMLCQTQSGLSLERTRLIVFDSHVSNKQFTVCTLKDTAPHCASLLVRYILPELKRRNDLKLSFF